MILLKKFYNKKLFTAESGSVHSIVVKIHSYISINQSINQIHNTVFFKLLCIYRWPMFPQTINAMYQFYENEIGKLTHLK